MTDLGLEEAVMSLGKRGTLGFSVLRFWSMFIVNCGFGRFCLAVLIAEVCGFIRFHIFFYMRFWATGTDDKHLYITSAMTWRCEMSDYRNVRV